MVLISNLKLTENKSIENIMSCCKLGSSNHFLANYRLFNINLFGYLEDVFLLSFIDIAVELDSDCLFQ